MKYSVVSQPGTLRPMLRLATPVLVEQSLIMLVGLVDTWLAARFLGEDKYLAAIGLMSYVMWLLPSLFAALALGAAAMVSRFVGSGDTPQAARVTNQAIMAGLLFAVLVTALTYFAGGWFIGIMQLEDDAAELALRQLNIFVFVIPAIMIESVGIACLRGAGDTTSGVVAMCLVNVVNLVVSATLVAGFDLPPLAKWDGIAIGTATAHALGAIMILALLMRGRAGLRLSLFEMRPDGELIRRMLRVGIPGGVDVLLIVFCHLWYLAIINGLGTAAAAAHSLGLRIESIAYLPGTAFQVAAATMAGQFLGANDRRRAARSVFMAVLVGCSIMTAAGFVMFFGGNLLTDLFMGADQQSSATARTTIALLKIVAISMPSLALGMVLTGALRGAGDTRWPLIITMIGYFGVRIPLAYVFSRYGVHVPFTELVIVGVYGAWWAMVLDVVLRSVLIFLRFWHGGWTTTKV